MFRRPTSDAAPAWALTLGVVALLVVALAALALLGARSLPGRTGPPIEGLAVERTVLSPGVMELTVRNTGPDPVQVAQVFVNDVYVDVTGATEPIGRLGSDTMRLAFPWQNGQPYLVSMLTSTGLVVDHEIPAAVPTPQGSGFVASMALLGTYVGIIPVLLGMLFLPVLRRTGRQPCGCCSPSRSACWPFSPSTAPWRASRWPSAPMPSSAGRRWSSSAPPWPTCCSAVSTSGCTGGSTATATRSAAAAGPGSPS
jgi:hypothetical protein